MIRAMNIHRPFTKPGVCTAGWRFSTASRTIRSMGRKAVDKAEAAAKAAERKEIGERLRLTREAEGLIATTACKLVGCSTKAWSNWERGTKRISVDEIKKLRTAWGTG